MGKDKGYSADVRILDAGIFKHRGTFQHLGDVQMSKFQMCRFMGFIF
jgi:hypothetical protein